MFVHQCLERNKLLGMPSYPSCLFSRVAGSTEGSSENSQSQSSSVSLHAVGATLTTAGFHPVENWVLIFPCPIIDCYMRTDSPT